MESNLKVFDEWEKTILGYKTLSFIEAQNLYKKATNTSDDSYMEDLIMGTLYVVSDFIKSNGLLYLNSTTYDMNDIISSSIEIWIDKINSGKLLKVKSFKDIFDGDYFNRLCDSLGISKPQITGVDAFVDLLCEYIKFYEKEVDFNYMKFIDYMLNNEKYKTIISRMLCFKNSFDFLNTFDGIIRSFKLEDSELKLSKTKLNKLKYILISNGLECLRENINSISVNDSTELYIDDYCKKHIVDIVENSILNSSQKNIIFKRYGFVDGKCHSLTEVAKEYSVTSQRIRQKEAKALRILRNKKYKNQFEDLV